MQEEKGKPGGWAGSPGKVGLCGGQAPREQRGLLCEESWCRDGGGERSATAEERKRKGNGYASKPQPSYLSLLVLAKT